MSSREKEVLKTKLCCACKKEKTLKQFYKNKLFIDGYMSRCKSCRAQSIRCIERKRIKNENNGRELTLHGVTMNDYIETYKFLQKMGYSLDKDLHEQFCDRHNLPTRKKPFERCLKFTPKELGLI